MQKFRGFFGGKDRFVIKIPVLTPKTRFSRRKEYFTSEIVFYSGILSFFREKLAAIPDFIRWKRPFRNKNTSFNTKTRFSRIKDYFTSEIVFYIGNLTFCREKLAEIPGFFRWKKPFSKKKYQFQHQNQVFWKKRVLYI